MRLIDADTLMEKFAKLQMVIWLDSVEEAEIASMIGNAPSIDIVRCKECRHWWEEEEICAEEHHIIDSVIGVVARPDDFCSRGERRDNEN